MNPRKSVILDEETAQKVQVLATDESRLDCADADLIIERLRRLEDEARCGQVDRQTLQKIISARRLLGDRVDFGKVKGRFTRM